MILNSLTLNNIRSYDHKMIKFPKGITLFEGDVGSGKSTMILNFFLNTLHSISDLLFPNTCDMEYSSDSIVLFTRTVIAP